MYLISKFLHSAFYYPNLFLETLDSASVKLVLYSLLIHYTNMSSTAWMPVRRCTLREKSVEFRPESVNLDSGAERAIRAARSPKTAHKSSSEAGRRRKAQVQSRSIGAEKEQRYANSIVSKGHTPFNTLAVTTATA